MSTADEGWTWGGAPPSNLPDHEIEYRFADGTVMVGQHVRRRAVLRPLCGTWPDEETPIVEEAPTWEEGALAWRVRRDSDVDQK